MENSCNTFGEKFPRGPQSTRTCSYFGWTNVRSCHPIRHVAGYCHSSCLRKLDNLRIGCFGDLVRLLGGLQLLQDQHIGCQPGYHGFHGPAGDELDIHHNQLVEIELEEGLIQGQCLLPILVDRLEIERGWVRWQSSNHQMALSRQRHQAGCPVGRSLGLGMRIQDQMHHEMRQMLRHQDPEAFGMTGPIRRVRTHPNLHLVRYHDRAMKILRNRLPQEMKRVHKERWGTCHILDILLHGDHPLRRMAHQRNYLLHTVGTGLSIEHSMGLSNRDGRKGNCRLGVVVDDLVEVERLGLFQVAAELKQLDLESYDRSFDLRQQLRNVTVPVGLHSAPLGGHHNHYKIFAEGPSLPVDPVRLVGQHTAVAGNSCYKHCVAEGPLYNRKKSRLARTRRHQSVAGPEIVFAGLDSPQTDFGRMALAG